MMTIKKKWAWYLPALLLLVPIVIPFKSELVIFPTDKELKTNTYNDNADSTGNSACVLTQDTGPAIVFDYTLRRSRGNPYAGFSIELHRADSFIDISGYDSVDVDIVTKQATSFEIHLKTFIENVTEINDFRTFHAMTYLVPVDIRSKRYSIPVEKFRIPDWWFTETYKKFGPKAANLPREPNYSKFFGINFQSGSGTQENVPDRFTVTKISFVKERARGPLALICITCFLTYVVLITIIFRPKLPAQLKRKTSDTPTPPQPAIPDMEPIRDEEVRRLEDFIGAHYQEPELTVEQVGHGSGISTVRVTSILQEKYNKTCKQYLNDIRITAAKQLLKTSDRTIAEIAFAVGYNNISHFNRVFKETVNCSPTEYRENEKAS